MWHGCRSYTLRAGLALSGLTCDVLWDRYVEVGGLASYPAFVFALSSGAPLPDTEHDLAAVALNALLQEQGLGCPVAYVHDLVS